MVKILRSPLQASEPGLKLSSRMQEVLEGIYHIAKELMEKITYGPVFWS